MTEQSPRPFGGAAFVMTQAAADYLGLCTCSITNLVSEGKLRKVNPQPRSPRITKPGPVLQTKTPTPNPLR